ncbi:HEAT repeat domain-containing protein [Methylobacterium planeticum]|uniref:HEAT repeat domain-containing protein n=1 Tax=Methylobacterium planeticum TaxID=2615211 RepID=UPI001FEE4DE7|nr:HEAT repeat domain-containing protein [Methylobacterium planeticum]
MALGAEGVPRVREAILAKLVSLADAGAAAALAPHLRSDDAGLRNSCVEALQAMPAAVLPILPALLRDADPDVRLLAAEIARTQASETASALLAAVLETEPHPNVCAAVIEVLAECGTAGAVPALRAARARFADAPFLPGAIDIVLARLETGS